MPCRHPRTPLAASYAEGVGGAVHPQTMPAPIAELARTDGHNHRPIAGNSELAGALKVLARAHRSLVWTLRACWRPSCYPIE